MGHIRKPKRAPKTAFALSVCESRCVGSNDAARNDPTHFDNVSLAASVMMEIAIALSRSLDGIVYVLGMLLTILCSVFRPGRLQRAC